MLVALYVGKGGWFNAVIRRWQRSHYSHCEVILRRVLDVSECVSSSISDGGVRVKHMRLKPEHWELWDVPCDDEQDSQAVRWAVDHEGDRYDFFGLLGFAWRPWRGSKSRWWCSEACAALLGLDEPWRYDVATFASAVKRLGKPVAIA